MDEILTLLAGGGDDEPEWHDKALCAQTDPEAFFPEKVDPPVRPSASVSPVRSARSAWSTPLRMTRGSESGADCPRWRGVGCASGRDLTSERGY